MRCGARHETAPLAVSRSARHSGIQETTKTRVVVLITQRSTAPDPCQNGQTLGVYSGHSRTVQVMAKLGRSRLTPCPRRPSKEWVTRATRAIHREHPRSVAVIQGHSTPLTSAYHSPAHGRPGYRPSKLVMRVRFPSPAPTQTPGQAGYQRMHWAAIKKPSPSFVPDTCPIGS
jgi:hypothetical protein